MSTRWRHAVVVGAGISGCLAALSLRRVIDDVEIVDRPTSAHIDFPLTVGYGLAEELREHGLSEAWDAWAGKKPLAAQLSAWGSPEMAREFNIIPSGQRYLVRRVELERFLKEAAQQRGIKVRARPGPQSDNSVVVDASGRSGQIARRRGAQRRATSALVAMHGVSLHSQLPDACAAVQSAADGWWFAVGEGGQAAVMHLTTRRATTGRSGVAVEPPRAFVSLVGEARFQRAISLASMSWLETTSADNWFAVGEAALALDPILGSGVEVAAQSAQLLRKAVGAEDPSSFYNVSMSQLIAKHRIARHRLYGRAASFHGGIFWTQQLRI